MKLILYSPDDEAGANICKIIREKHGFKPSGNIFGADPIFQKDDTLLAASQTNVKDLKTIPLKPEVCIVASRHKSGSGKPTLTCHPTGNFGHAELGGEDNSLQTTHAHYLRGCLLLLQEMKAKHHLPYEVSMEVTHHGPTNLPFPLIYVEVGGTAEQWGDMEACGAVAEALVKLVSGKPDPKPSAIGFGGPHYAPNFNQAVRDHALGHIMPKHAVENINESVVEEMLEKTVPRPETAVLDWKGMRGISRDRLQTILRKLDVDLVKTSDLK